jgi:glycosyltransferase involved in cell wall biosynthesis
MTDVSVILPVYNQVDIIEPVYRQVYQYLRRMKLSFECILVENGSTDGTEFAVEKLAKTHKDTRSIRTTKGYGSAVLAGLSVARGRYVCYMPSDGQVDLSVLPQLWKLAQTGAYHIVKIRRVTRENMMRSAISKFFTLLLTLRFRTPNIDINGSPRILRRKDMESLRLVHMDSFIDAEMAVKAKRLGWSITEIPMKNIPRYGGVSSRSWKTFAEFITNMLTFKPE